MDKNMKDILKAISFIKDYIVKHLATKEELAEVRKEMATGFSDIRKEMATKEDIAGIILELRDIKERLMALEDIVEDHSRYSKEIDHAFARIAAIEKHLGLKTK